ncbi:MAG: hypothetical protein B6U75_00330 [Desulfurococcales archaeon ex4484_217_1]|nr:MAG: hypothetical protein B6U75_00330 [Desulfurococcales archaeon ex4484_217_1]
MGVKDRLFPVGGTALILNILKYIVVIIVAVVPLIPIWTMILWLAVQSFSGKVILGIIPSDFTFK